MTAELNSNTGRGGIPTVFTYSRSLLMFFLFYLPIVGFPQINKRALLRDNHINRIRTFTVNKQHGNKYLSRISFVNDSGLIYKTIKFDERQDTIGVTFSEYDSLNREIFQKSIFRLDSVATYSYEYPTEGGVKTVESYLGNENRSFNVVKRHGRREVIYFFTNDKLTQTVIYRKKKYVWKYTSKRKNGLPKKMKGKEFFDAEGKIVKSISKTRTKQRVVIGGYTIENTQGQVEKDKTKYKYYRHEDVRLVTFKYNELGFISEIIYHPSPGFSRPGLYLTGQEYRCYMYEYVN